MTYESWGKRIARSSIYWYAQEFWRSSPFPWAMTLAGPDASDVAWLRFIGCPLSRICAVDIDRDAARVARSAGAGMVVRGDVSVALANASAAGAHVALINLDWTCGHGKDHELAALARVRGCLVPGGLLAWTRLRARETPNFQLLDGIAPRRTPLEKRRQLAGVIREVAGASLFAVVRYFNEVKSSPMEVLMYQKNGPAKKTIKMVTVETVRTRDEARVETRRLGIDPRFAKVILGGQYEELPS